jgi:hypothetical protein
MASEYSFNQPEVNLEPEGGSTPAVQRSAEPGRPLPLEATTEPWLGAWVGSWAVRLPLRAEAVTIDKQTVVVEEVAVRRRQFKEVVRPSETVRREELRLETAGELDVTQPIDVGEAPADPTGARSGRIRPR